MKKKTEKHLYQKILHLALDIKAFNEQVYDLREVSAEMDYVILINGNSMMHLKGIGENVVFFDRDVFLFFFSLDPRIENIKFIYYAGYSIQKFSL